MIENLKECIEFARKAHDGQVRKYSGEPYIEHPLQVLWLATHFNMPLHCQYAAVLHDVLEDTDITENQLRDNFHRNVCDLVIELTKRNYTGNRFERVSQEIKRLAGLTRYAADLKVLDMHSNLLVKHRLSANFREVYMAESYIKYLQLKKSSSLSYLLQSHFRSYKEDLYCKRLKAATI